MTFYQIVLPIFTLVFLIQVFLIQSYIQWKKTGIKPYVFGNTDSPHDYCGRVYKVMVLGTWTSIAFYSFFETQYKYLLPFWFMTEDWLQHVGLAIAFASFVWIILAQNQMSSSWRIGINYEEQPKLKRDGLFSVSRNPIFLGVLVSYIGTFLIIPNALSFSIMLLTYVVLQIQVRLEEEYLGSTLGEDYKDYKKQVRRWL